MDGIELLFLYFRSEQFHNANTIMSVTVNAFCWDAVRYHVGAVAWLGESISFLIKSQVILTQTLYNKRLIVENCAPTAVMDNFNSKTFEQFVAVGRSWFDNIKQFFTRVTFPRRRTNNQASVNELPLLWNGIKATGREV